MQAKPWLKILVMLLFLSAVLVGCSSEGDDEEADDDRDQGDDDGSPYVPDDDAVDDDIADDDVVDDDVVDDDVVDDDVVDDDVVDDDVVDDDVVDDDVVDDDVVDDDVVDDDVVDDDVVSPIPEAMIVDEGIEGYTDLALDAIGRPHIVYKKNLGGLRYAYWTGDEWELETVDSGNLQTGRHAAIVLDGDTPLTAYHNANQKTLKFARQTDRGWDVVVVDESAEVGAWCDITITGDDEIYISYHDSENGDLKVARYTDAWESEVVEDGVETGLYTSITCDDAGQIYISYYDAAARSLKMATGAFGSWTTEIVDQAPGEEDDRGRWTSIALDAMDRIHIAYQDAALLDLKYAVFEADGWTIETVDGIGNKGADACLMISDADNGPHIVYQDGSNLSLRYAKIVSDEWRFSYPMDSGIFGGSFGFWLGCGLRYSGPVVSHYYPTENMLLIYPGFN